MELTFEELTDAFHRSPLSVDILRRITSLLNQQSEISSSALLVVEQRSWELLSEDPSQWVHEPHYQEFFHSLASFNKNLIFHRNDIDVDLKASLLFPVNIDQIKIIFKQIEQTTDVNDPYIIILALCIDNHSYFLHEYPHWNAFPITDHICQYIIHNYVMTEQFKHYIYALRQPQLAQSMFTAKMLFYIKTCSLRLFSHIEARMQRCPYRVDEILRSIGNDYLYIIHIHSLSVTSWSKELLTCMAHLISFVSESYWWSGQQANSVPILFSNEQEMCSHIEDLIRIIGHRPFQEQIIAVLSNDETILIKGAFAMLISFVHAKNMGWFFRDNPAIQNVISTLGEESIYDEICLCAYGILGEVMTDEQLKDLKIVENINEFFFRMLETAWRHPSKRYRKIPIEYLLRGKLSEILPKSRVIDGIDGVLDTRYLNLLRHDIIKQKTADRNKTSLLIEMCDEYPIMYDILWSLSFNHDIQEQLHSTPSFMSKLYHLENECNNEQMRKTTQGILWNLQFPPKDSTKAHINDAATFDIMISYSHKEKIHCHQIYEELTKTGYRVWIDFDQMHGNVMDAMAHAIDRCQTVIICISEQYRQSNYCRAEAQYAFQRQRKIVPVLLQKHYKPDGWLLFLVGQLLYVDFTKHEFPKAIQMLMKELKSENMSTSTGGCLPTAQIINALPTVPPASLPSIQTQNILDWSHDEAKKWLLAQNLVQMSRLLTDCDGRSLVYLNRYMRHGEVRQILKSLEKDSLRLTNESLSVLELSRFQSLLDQELQFARTATRTRHLSTNSDTKE